MDLQKIAQMGLDNFNDRTFRVKDKDLVDPNIVVVDAAAGQEVRGWDAYVEFNDGFIKAMPDVKGTLIEHKVSGNTVTTRVRGTGTFTGTLQTPQGAVSGNGNRLDLEYSQEQEFNDAGKVVRITVRYDMQAFMRQLGLG